MLVLICVLTAVGTAVAPVPGGAAPASQDEPSPSRVDHIEFPSDLVDTSTTGGTLAGGRDVPELFVFVPEGYDDDPDADYPVLWLLHGANTPASHSAEWIQEMAPDFPGIVVMPDGGTFGMYTDWWNGGRRGDPAWTTYHLVELMDHIESTYRIRPGREWHTIMGISMGGQGALRYAALRPDYFGSVVALSAAMPDIQSLLFQGGLGAIILLGGAPDGVDYSAVWGSPSGAYAEGNSPQALIANLEHTRVFLSSGNGINCPGDPTNGPDALVLDTVTETFINAQQLLFQLELEAAHVDVTARTTCGVHTFGVWDRAWRDVRGWGFFGRSEVGPGDDWTYRTIRQSGTMWGLDFRFDRAPQSIVRFSRSGDILRASGASGVTELTDAAGCTRHETIPFEISMDDGWTCPAADDLDPPAADVDHVAAPVAPPSDRGQLPATGSNHTPLAALVVAGLVVVARLRHRHTTSTSGPTPTR